jgi:cytochrome c5
MFNPYRIPLAAILVAVVVVVGAACSPAGEEQGAAVERPEDPPGGSQVAREVQPDWRADRLDLGETTYASACASCHDAGEAGAPRTGVREDWSERSDLWQAVLFNHAKAGYLEMPGKGGQPELTDEAVEAATEYMLGLTFPELPKD